MKKILTFIIEHATGILVSLLIVLIVAFSLSVRSCSNAKNDVDSATKSIEAIYDSISYYRTKNGDLVAEKKLLEGKISLLKITNEELYNRLEEMDKTKADRVVYVENVVQNPPDTIYWQIEHNDSVEVKKYFDFTNKYRSLQGYVSHYQNNLGLNITKDEVYFDYTVAMKDNQVFITSSNPYVKYNEITGLVVPTKTNKNKHWHIGPTLTVGYDVMHNNWAVTPGISLTYSLISF